MYEAHGRTLQLGGLYRHFKNHRMRYKVLMTAKHSETEETMVIYTQLYGDGTTWARPLEVFLDTVERDGYTGYRFTLLDS